MLSEIEDFKIKEQQNWKLKNEKIVNSKMKSINKEDLL